MPVCAEVGAGPPPGPGLPRGLLEKVGRAVPAGDRLWFRQVCRSWAAAGAGAAQGGGEGLPRGKVTRTRGADAAASVARAETVRRMVMVLDGHGNNFDHGICQYAAEGGCLSVLKWARAQGRHPGTQAHRHPWDKWTCAYAAEYGQLAVLQWARAQGCPWDE